jgi:two-component system, chemotaxis family, chemotaxis protein CheY
MGNIDKTDFRIMTVDDFFSMRRIVMNLMKELGFANFIEADNGASAWKQLETQRVDLIICDWNMPKMTGLELLAKVRADDRFKNIPFLMVTAESEKTKVVEAVKAGVTNYILKPFTPDSFKQKVSVILESIS